MFFIILVLSIFAFARTLGYAVYEYKQNDNKVSAVVITVLACVVLVGPCIVTLI